MEITTTHTIVVNDVLVFHVASLIPVRVTEARSRGTSRWTIGVNHGPQVVVLVSLLRFEDFLYSSLPLSATQVVAL